jgi:hypothetical protein
VTEHVKEDQGNRFAGRRERRGVFEWCKRETAKETPIPEGSVVVGSHTTLGLKGGSTFRFSSRAQLMVLKKGWVLMFPVTPSLFCGSLSNS